jgi:glutamate--cysteine ligase
MNKPRYQAMTDYFNRIGPYGIRMMRQTSTLQVNLDFGPGEQSMVDRFMLSQLLAPVSTAIFAYSPAVDGKLTDKKSFRSFIWQNVDPGRTGFDRRLNELSLTSSKSELVAHYLDFILDASVVFIESSDFAMPARDFSFRKWLKEGFDGTFPTMRDFETHLSLHFPEVRMRGFLELRSMDAQSKIWQSVPAGLQIPLFYDEQTCAKALQLLMPYHGREVEFWQKSSYGMQDAELANIAQEVFKLAMEGLQRLPSCFREQFEDKKLKIYWDKFTARRRTPADDMIEIIEKHGEIPANVFTILDDMWFQY